jgi:hypothetical protein
MKTTFILLIALTSWQVVFSQQASKPIRAGLFTSLYLDSSFDASGKYRLKNTFPRQAIAGLEYYEGSVMAIDSLNRTGTPVTLSVFDIQSKKGNINTLLQNRGIDSLDILFAQVGGTAFVELASISKQKNIPLVSASYPNDAGIRNSPMVHIANPTINSHLQVIYNQVKTRWPNANVLLFRGRQAGDEVIESVLTDLKNTDNAGGIPFKSVILSEQFEAEDIYRWIDTNKTNVLIPGSLDESFSIEFARAIAGYSKKGIVQLVGMPNWDGLREILTPAYFGLPIYYTTGFFIPNGHVWSNSLEENFKNYTGVKPSSSVYKGFELTYYFISLMAKYKGMIFNKPEDNSFKVLNDYDFRPVQWSAGSPEPDYYENKRIYFVRRLNGVASVQ